MDDAITAREFHASEGVEDWRVLGEGASAFFRTGSFAESAGLVAAIGAIDGLEDHPPDVDLRHAGGHIVRDDFAPMWWTLADAAGQGRYAWLMFLPMLMGAVVILWAGIQMFIAEPVAGAALTIAGGVYFAIVLRFLARLSRSVTSAGPNDDIATAITEPVVDYLTTLTGLILVGGLVAVVVLIVWGLGQTAR